MQKEYEVICSSTYHHVLICADVNDQIEQYASASVIVKQNFFPFQTQRHLSWSAPWAHTESTTAAVTAPW
jgi:hypothetical protein